MFKADTAWTLVNTPHDSVIGLAPVNGTAYHNDAGTAASLHGFLNRTISWYRKRFFLLTEWRGNSAIHIEFNGVYHYAQVFVNGRWDTKAVLRVHSVRVRVRVRVCVEGGWGWGWGGAVFLRVRLRGFKNSHHCGPCVGMYVHVRGLPGR